MTRPNKTSDFTTEQARYYVKRHPKAASFYPTIDGKLMKRFHPMLGKKRVLLKHHPKNGFSTQDAAIKGAIEFRDFCRDHVKEIL